MVHLKHMVFGKSVPTKAVFRYGLFPSKKGATGCGLRGVRRSEASIDVGFALLEGPGMIILGYRYPESKDFVKAGDRHFTLHKLHYATLYLVL